MTLSLEIFKDFMASVDKKMRIFNNEAQTIFNDIVIILNKDMENTNEDADDENDEEVGVFSQSQASWLFTFWFFISYIF